MKKYLLRGALVTLLVIALVFFVGFDCFDYDPNHPSIGKEVKLQKPMVYLTNLDKNAFPPYIIKKYGRIMMSETNATALYITASYPDINIQNVPNDEKFVIEEVFYRRPIGFLKYTFSSGSTKWFVLKSSDGILNPVLGESYE